MQWIWALRNIPIGSEWGLALDADQHLLKLFRLDAVHVDEGDHVDHHFTVSGRTVRLRHFLIEENRKEDDIAAWVAKHNRYARLQADDELARVPRRDASGGRRTNG